MHQSILENKGSDTMTLKRKSEAWDNIALRMKAAGYNRSKERLKQQLGRIRAAEAKKIKDALERTLTAEEIKKINNANNNFEIEGTIINSMTTCVNGKENKQNQEISNKLPISVALEEHHYIKTEHPATINEIECIEEELSIVPNANNNKSNINNVNNQTGDDHNIHFKLQSVQSLAEIKQKDCMIETIEPNYTSNITCSSIDSNLKLIPVNLEENHISSCENEENSTSSFPTANKNNEIQQEKPNRPLRRIRTKRIRNSFTRVQGLRQLYTYRIAIERERLRSLKIQQKRDRILYLKDIEIQNLKLQILRNLSNQNHDANHINL
ncbi:uncharacterized protein ACRADG_010919 isoform 2-T2 [Cochliomyia hominivorax]